MLRRVGDLTAEEVAERVFEGIGPEQLLLELERERRAIRLRVGGEERFIAADEAGLYRDALGAAPPGGLPEAFLAEVPDALSELVARYASTHGPFTTEEIQARYRVDVGAVLRELERAGELVRGELRPNAIHSAASSPERVGSTTLADGRTTIPADGREWCDVEVLRRLRRASLAALRKEIEPADARALAAFLPSWQGVDRHSGSGAGVDRLREVLVGLQGLALPVEIWERDVLPRRVGAYSQAWMDGLCASGEVVWVGAGSIGRRSGRVALYFREDAPLIGPPPMPRAQRRFPRAESSPAGPETPSGGSSASSSAGVGQSPLGAPEHEILRARLAAGPCFFSDLIAELDVPAEALREALWDLVWAGEATNDAWAPLRAPHLTLARGGGASRGETTWAGSGSARGAAAAAGLRGGRSMVGRSRFASRRAGAQAQVQGRWSLTEGLFAGPAERRPSASTSPARPGFRRLLLGAPPLPLLRAAPLVAARVPWLLLGAPPLPRAPARARRAAAGALRDRHPRAGAGRGDKRGLRDAL